MNRSEWPAAAFFNEGAIYVGMVVGTGASAPVSAPTTFSNSSSKGFMSPTNNFVSNTIIPTRSGVGAYTVTFKDTLPVVFDIDPNVWGPNGTTCTMVDYNPSTRVATILAWSAVGAPVDLAATEFLRFTITGQKSPG